MNLKCIGNEAEQFHMRNIIQNFSDKLQVESREIK